MGFSGEVHHGIDVICANEFSNSLLVANIRLHELVSGFSRNILEVFQAACIGEQVQVQYKHVGKMLERIVDEVRADKAGAACYKHA